MSAAARAASALRNGPVVETGVTGSSVHSPGTERVKAFHISLSLEGFACVRKSRGNLGGNPDDWDGPSQSGDAVAGPGALIPSAGRTGQRNENITPTSGAQSVAFEVSPNELFSLT